MKEKYEKELEFTRTNSKDERTRLAKDHEALIGRIQREHKEERTLANTAAAQDIARLREVSSKDTIRIFCNVFFIFLN